jgi:phage recombination protein Bet
METAIEANGNGKELMPPKTGEVITTELVMQYLDAFGLAGKLRQHEIRQFVEMCKIYQLNPFKREIYCVPYGEGDRRRVSIIVAYDVYIKRAERTGLLDGWRAHIEESGGEVTAIATIYRKDWSHPFVHQVYQREVAKDGKIWKEMPRFMLKKVAIAQAFRMCFPEDMGGMPYISEELPAEMKGGYHDIPAEYIAPSKTNGTVYDAEGGEGSATWNDNFVDFEPQTSEGAPIEEKHILSVGEAIGKWFWNLSKEQRDEYLPPNCRVAKMNGQWVCAAKDTL